MKLCRAMWMTIVVLFTLWSAPLTPARAQFSASAPTREQILKSDRWQRTQRNIQRLAASSIDLYSGRSRGHPGRFGGRALLTCRPPNWKSSSTIWRNGWKC